MMTRAGLANQDLEFIQFHPTGKLGGRGSGLGSIPQVSWEGGAVVSVPSHRLAGREG